VERGPWRCSFSIMRSARSVGITRLPVEYGLIRFRLPRLSVRADILLIGYHVPGAVSSSLRVGGVCSDCCFWESHAAPSSLATSESPSILASADTSVF
jgi:hypothetical protein